MDRKYDPGNWFEDRLDRSSQERRFLITDRPTITDRYRLKELVRAVDVRLSDVEDRLHILEERKEEKKSVQGSRETEITSSFETLFFWLRMLEKNAVDYSSKVPVETEFGPRVRIIKRKIRILARRSRSVHPLD